MNGENRLVRALPRADRMTLLAVAETVQMHQGDVLQRAGARALHVYLPLQGFISLLHTSETDDEIEVAVVGREGIVGAHLALGVPVAPLLAMVQAAGASLRIEAGRFERLLAGSPVLQGLIKRFLYVQMVQLATASSCTRHHDISARLARWLLLCHDRIERDDFPMTHEFLGYMLGVRRVGITQAAGTLQQRGLLAYRRGAVRVLDRPGLEAAACACYASDVAAYQRFLGRRSVALPRVNAA